MSITNKLNQIKNAIYGKDVRGAIHDAIKECYDDASVNHDNANMEVKMARGTYNTLNDRLNKTDEIQAQTNAQLSDVEKKIQFVTYEEFGAVGDGVTNDFKAFVDAHNFANDNNLKVIAMKPSYLLINDASKTLTIQTDTDWSNATIILDNPEDSDFTIWIRGKSEKINLSTELCESLRSKINNNDTNLSDLATLKNSFVSVSSADEVEIIRESPNTIAYKRDYILVESDGSVITHYWNTYNNAITATAYKLSNHTLEFLFGKVITNTTSRTGYYNFRFTNIDNVSIKNLRMTGNNSKSNAVISLVDCYNVTLDNMYFQSAESNGAYGLIVQGCINVVVNNCISSLDARWGVMGSNYVENLTIVNSTLSRIDVHYRCYNLYVDNCILGQNGIQVTGGGQLSVSNTTVLGGSILQLRGDFGSSWLGDISIRDCKMVITRTNKRYFIIEQLTKYFDYQSSYKLHILGDNISIENIKIEGASVFTDILNVGIIGHQSHMAQTDMLCDYQLPNNITIKNVSGDYNQLTLLFAQSNLIRNANQPVVAKGLYKYGFDYNAKIICENVDFGSSVSKDTNLITIWGNSDNSYYDQSNYVETAYFPKINFINCENVTMHPSAMTCELAFDNCIIVGGRFWYGSYSLYTYVEVNNSKIKFKNISNDTSKLVASTNCYVSLNNVEIMRPTVGGMDATIDQTVTIYGIYEGLFWLFGNNDNKVKLNGVYYDKFILNNFASNTLNRGTFFTQQKIDMMNYKEWDIVPDSRNYIGAKSNMPKNPRNGQRYYVVEARKEYIYYGDGWYDLNGTKL